MEAIPSTATPRELSEYLRAKSEAASRAKEGTSGGAGCLFTLGIGLVVFGLATEALWGMASGVLAIMIAIFVSIAAGEKRAKQRVASWNALNEFVWLWGQKSFETRIDPRVLPHLESCALSHRRIVLALDSPMWIERKKDSNWRQIHEAAQAAVEKAMLDALTVSLILVRTKGMKKVEFEARCANPDYGEGAIERLGAIEQDLGHLAERVGVELTAPQEEESGIRKVLTDLQQLHEAQSELDADVPRMTE